ncbi:MAG: ATP-binding protein [Lachnospiraceae bacterium]|nr:ATP-binding protein [Lachnospiraceae bacterium]
MKDMIFYNNAGGGILKEMAEAAKAGEAKPELKEKLFSRAAGLGLEGDAWCGIIAESLLLDENTYSLSKERRKIKSSLDEAVMGDMKAVYRLINARIPEGLELLSGFVPPVKSPYPAQAAEAVKKLAMALKSAGGAAEVKEALDETYQRFGVGEAGFYEAFCLDAANEIIPLKGLRESSLDELVGYEKQKAQLCGNTEAFVRGGRANNCLLYGEAGTGKSSSIRAVLHRYYAEGLRMVEVYRHQYRELAELIRGLSSRNYRYVIYLDDLSFEEFEVEYKFLKALIEGGLEERPENVLIYATSNRRHLVRESFGDRPESPLDKHQNETVQEKLSLFGRFGLSIYYPAPAYKEYLGIVRELALRSGLTLSAEELDAWAKKWELQNNGPSGRSAAQLIEQLRWQEEGNG